MWRVVWGLGAKPQAGGDGMIFLNSDSDTFTCYRILNVYHSCLNTWRTVLPAKQSNVKSKNRKKSRPSLVVSYTIRGKEKMNGGLPSPHPTCPPYG